MLAQEELRALRVQLHPAGRLQGAADAAAADATAGDAAFWAGAPRLDGDWPEEWRRGLQYDLNTVRANIRPAVGVFKHQWDAMQVHGPRAVEEATHLVPGVGVGAAHELLADESDVDGTGHDLLRVGGKWQRKAGSG